jgi:hypothetical protein
MFELQGALGSLASSAKSLPGLQRRNVVDGKNLGKEGKKP